MTNRVSFRVKKQYRHTLHQVDRHNRREDRNDYKRDYIFGDSSKNKELIENAVGRDLSELVDERIQELGVTGIKKASDITKKGKQGTVLCYEIVLTATPDYFRPDDPDKAGHYDPERLQAWVDANVKFLKEEFGDNLISIQLHLDEKTPHLHCETMPLIQKELKKRRTNEQRENNEPAETYTAWRFDAAEIFNPQYIQELQEKSAEAVKHLGIKRGLKGSNAKHISPKEFRRRVNEAPGKTFKFIKASVEKVKEAVLEGFDIGDYINPKNAVKKAITETTELLTSYYRKKFKELNKENESLNKIVNIQKIENEQLKDRLFQYDEMFDPELGPTKALEQIHDTFSHIKELEERVDRAFDEGVKHGRKEQEEFITNLQVENSDFRIINNELETENDKLKQENEEFVNKYGSKEEVKNLRNEEDLTI